MCACVCVCVCVCGCVCVSAVLCVCVCVCGQAEQQGAVLGAVRDRLIDNPSSSARNTLAAKLLLRVEQSLGLLGLYSQLAAAADGAAADGAG